MSKWNVTVTETRRMTIEVHGPTSHGGAALAAKLAFEGMTAEQRALLPSEPPERSYFAVEENGATCAGLYYDGPACAEDLRASGASKAARHDRKEKYRNVAHD